MRDSGSPHSGLLALLVSVIVAAPLLADNVRLGFAQVAVGDRISTTIDLTNMGLEAFDGTLVVLDDNGDPLEVLINGDPVAGPLDLLLAPSEVRRFVISSVGEVRIGHALVRDRKDFKSVAFGQQIDGTAIFEVRNESGEVVDSVGVPGSSTMFLGSGVRQHFFFVGEVGTAGTGVALANVLPGQASVDLTARASDGTSADEVTIGLAGFGHRAFFIHEVMTLPAGFRGTVEVEADRPIFALALRVSETAQLSTIQVSALPLFFDFEVELLGGPVYSGEMTLNAADGLIRGLARLTSHDPDGDFDVSPVTGSFIPGLGIIGSFYTSIDGNVVSVIFLGMFTVSLSNDNTFPAAWARLDGTTPATLKLTRRATSVASATVDRGAFQTQAGPLSVAGFDDVAAGTRGPFTTPDNVAVTGGIVRDDSITAGSHFFFFGSSGSLPNFLDTEIDLEVKFPHDVTAAGFDVACFACDDRPNDSVFGWKLFSQDGGVIASGATVFDFAGKRSGFLGFVSTESFRSLTVSRAPSANWFLDDLQYSDPPP